MNDSTLKTMFSKESDHWATPSVMYSFFTNKNYFDPCPLHAKNYDFVVRPFKMFINPPYSNIVIWVDYAIKCHKVYQNNIIILVPSRTDTKWFHKLLDYGVELQFIKGRLKFNDSKNSAPFPSVLIKLNGKESTLGCIYSK